MKTLIKNKNAMALNTELIIAVFAIILIGVIGILTTIYTGNAKNQLYTIAPNLTYQFPAVFTHTFLMIPLTKEEKRSLNLLESQDYFVKDLIIMGTDDAKTLWEEKREEYIDKYTDDTDDYSSPLYYYKIFSKNEIKNHDNLLTVVYDEKFSSDLESEIKRDNYFFYTKTYNDNYAIIKFYSG